MDPGLSVVPPDRRDDDRRSSVQSVDEDIHRLMSYHGREYQEKSWRREVSLCPIDDNEMDRLDAQHQMLNLIFADKQDPLFVAPIETHPSRILDCGHGAGSWAMQVAAEEPDCEVTGVDISLQMNPTDDVPENLEFQIANLNDRFTFAQDSFDLVNSRFVASGIAFSRWPNYIADIKRVLKPGGWVQMIEWNLKVQSESGLEDHLWHLREWHTRYSSALGHSAVPQGTKDANAHAKLETLLRGAGFIEVSSEQREIPASPWSADPKKKDIGEMNRKNICEMLPSLSLWPLTVREKMPLPAFNALVQNANEELNNLEPKPYLMLCICWARKAY